MSTRNEINRREFVLGASAVTVSGVLSASAFTQIVSDKKQTIHPLTIPTEPVLVRVRVGRFRNGQRTTINGGQVRAIDGVLQTTNSIKDLFNKDEDLHFVSHKKSTFTIGSGEKQKIVTGKLHVHACNDNDDTAFDVVAHVPIEQYLPGVLAGELYAHWHPDTFAAQAVAARSYAIVQHLNRIDKSHFDVTDGPSSQMFLGDVTLEAAHNAAKVTQGVILAWDSTVVPAYYSACCGGRAASALDAISTSTQHEIPPLFGRKGKDVCHSLESATWRATRSSRMFRMRLNDYAKRFKIPELESLRSVRSIEPCEFNKHGRPTKLAIRDRRRKRHYVNARNFLSAANASVSALPSTTETIWSSTLSCTKSGNELSFEGRGMGHGVGLCQYGAQELAGQNKSWESILQWYYPQASIQAI